MKIAMYTNNHSQWGGKIHEVKEYSKDKAANITLIIDNGKDENGNNAMYRLGHFFIVINPEFFMGLDTFRSTSGDILRSLRASTKAPGEEKIYTAGEKEWLAWQDRKDKGVPVGDAIQKEFIQLRDECGLSYKFPFEA